MKRILIIGSGGAGKSTLARELEKIVHSPVIHLDSYYWKPGWIEPSKEDWKKDVESLISKESWIMDGNYGGTMELRLNACDTVFYLDFSRFLCLFRVLKRSIIHYGRSRPDLNEGCPEQLPSWEFLKYIWVYPKIKSPVIRERLSNAKLAGKRIIIVKSPRKLSAIVTELQAAGSSIPYSARH